MNPWLPPLLLLPLVTRLPAQSEAALKESFEGRTVTAKLALPGTENGVDIYPGTARPLDYPKYADRIKDFGTAIKAGEQVVVTKVITSSSTTPAWLRDRPRSRFSRQRRRRQRADYHARECCSRTWMRSSAQP